MVKNVRITQEESEKVEELFSNYNAYMSMLQLLSSGGEFKDNALFDRKWNEAVEIWKELEKAKYAVEVKYKPEGDWDSYEFVFDKSEVKFTRND